jgi:hypothetical protein
MVSDEQQCHDLFQMCVTERTSGTQSITYSIASSRKSSKVHK